VSVFTHPHPGVYGIGDFHMEHYGWYIGLGIERGSIAFHFRAAGRSRLHTCWVSWQ
jgi:hypothetical protein